MLGNIIIDGFRCRVKIRENVCSAVKATMKLALEKHFNRNAYSLYYKFGYLYLSFNPSRYFGGTFNGDDYNLEAPPEKELYNLFKKMGFYNIDKYFLEDFSITLVHLTKNFLMEEKIENYTNYLRQRSFKKRFKPIEVKSDLKSTLTLATLDRKYDDSKAKDRKFIFYDKVKELKDKTNRNLYYINLKLPLTEEEKLLIPATNRTEEGRCIHLEGLHILGFEQQYQHKTKLEPLTKYLQGDDYKRGLKLSTFLKLLEEGQLYKKLDEFYTQQAKEIVFHEDISEGVPLTEEEQLLKDLLNGCDDYSFITESFPKTSQKNRFKELVKKIQKRTCNDELYRELYNKIVGV